MLGITHRVKGKLLFVSSDKIYGLPSPKLKVFFFFFLIFSSNSLEFLFYWLLFYYLKSSYLYSNSETSRSLSSSLSLRGHGSVFDNNFNLGSRNPLIYIINEKYLGYLNSASSYSSFSQATRSAETLCAAYQRRHETPVCIISFYAFYSFLRYL